MQIPLQRLQISSQSTFSHISLDIKFSECETIVFYSSPPSRNVSFIRGISVFMFPGEKKQRGWPEFHCLSLRFQYYFLLHFFLFFFSFWFFFLRLFLASFSFLQNFHFLTSFIQEYVFLFSSLLILLLLLVLLFLSLLSEKIHNIQSLWLVFG